MKRILRCLLVLVFLCSIFNAVKAEDIENVSLDEISLDIQEETEETPQAVEITKEQGNLSLREKLENVYHLDVSKYDKPNFLLKEVFTHHYGENPVMDRTQFWAAYNGSIGLNFIQSGDLTNHYDTNALNVGIDGFLKDNNADFRIMLNLPTRQTRNVMQSLFADVYVGTNKIPHHRIMVGNTRPPVGYEGGASPYVLPFVARSQISRNFGTVRKLGARVNGDYSYMDYDLGVYSSDTYFQEFFPGAEFIGWVNFKPLAKNEDKYGKLKIGGGIDTGHRDNNFMVAGAHIGYEYKRFSADFEWAQGNGYNGTAGYSSNKHADGFYATLAYMLTQKLQLLVRYDQFDPDRHIANNNKREYTAGFNYFVKGQGFKIMLNYVFCQNDNSKDSHRIILGTQILI